MATSAPDFDRFSKQTTLALIPLGIALNLALGTIVRTLRLPVYIDEVGTICVTLLVGLRAGLFTGVFSFVIGGLLINPVLLYFTGTQAAVALYTWWIGSRGGYRSLTRSILAGMGLGIVAAIVSAPVDAYVFGGITGSGASFITAFLLYSGQSLLKSVVLSGLAAEPLDKTLQTLLAVYLLKSLPKSLLSRFEGGSLRQNGFLP